MTCRACKADAACAHFFVVTSSAMRSFQLCFVCRCTKTAFDFFDTVLCNSCFEPCQLETHNTAAFMDPDTGNCNVYHFCGGKCTRLGIKKFNRHRKQKGTKPEYYCSNCAERGRLKSCSRCRLTRYCSTECQKQHWSKHKKVCKPPT